MLSIIFSCSHWLFLFLFCEDSNKIFYLFLLHCMSSYWIWKLFIYFVHKFFVLYVLWIFSPSLCLITFVFLMMCFEEQKILILVISSSLFFFLYNFVVFFFYSKKYLPILKLLSFSGHTTLSTPDLLLRLQRFFPVLCFRI